MKYSLMDFQDQFPDDRSVLDYLFASRFPKSFPCPECGKTDCFYPVEKRRSYSCSWCGHQVYPTAGTIFHKSSTSLRLWFFAIFLMAQSRNGVAAKELERQLGVTYKTAWRMAHEIRKLMGGKPPKFKGEVEADETYIGGKRPGKRGRGAAGKTAVVGVVNRSGGVVAVVAPVVNTAHAMSNLLKTTEQGATVHTDELNIYNLVGKLGFTHHVVRHGAGEYVRGRCHTNSIEGFWSQLKRSIDGTHHHVSAKHLQKYVNEFAFRYSNRYASEDGTTMFALMAGRAPLPRDAAA
jgi:transposase-like protein